MSTERDTQSPDLSVADKLDNEIANLRAQVESLKEELKLQTATLLTAAPVRQLLQERPRRGAARAEANAKQKLLAQSDKQAAHQQQCLYRACASITALRVHDPDPHAVDVGNILGLRFEIMSRSRFIRPYYVMLNRPFSNRNYLRIHRHTVPPCIPLGGLAARYLPAPKPSGDDEGQQSQDLSQFARALRRELVRYQNRIGVIGDLRKAAGLSSRKGKEKASSIPISEISAADAEAKQIRVDWEDGRTGRLIMSDDGEIVKMFAQGERGRDREAVRELLGDSARIEELIQRLQGS
ncbi:cenp-O kinetochore centromere component [Xylariales sp. PMI_506]|nr:cenp-O kinetochore centromere component [Xylariales sp. PMI_506]